MEEKNRLSHRARAIINAKPILKKDVGSLAIVDHGVAFVHPE